MIYPVYDELVGLRKSIAKDPLRSRTRATSAKTGRQASLFKGRGLDFSEVREYTADDDVRAIDWRVTARTGRPHSKVFTEERERSVYVFVDVGSRMQFGTRKTFKSVQAARATAVIAWLANRFNDPFGAVLFGRGKTAIKVLRATSSRKSIWEVLNSLCAKDEVISTQPNTETHVDEALLVSVSGIPRGASVFVISDFLNCGGDFERALVALSERRDLTLIQITDVADAKIADIGRILFRDQQGQSALVDTGDARGAKEYAENFRQRMSTFERAAARARAKVIRLTTESDVGSVLMKELKVR